MSKRTSKASLSNEEDKQSMMTVHHKKDFIDSSYFTESSPMKQSPWPAIESTSSSRDVNSRATSFSLPEEIEEEATRKVWELWHAVERTLYDEEDQVTQANIREECIQWRTQIPHLRVVGKSMTIKTEEDDSETGVSVENKNDNATDKLPDNAEDQDNSRETNASTPKNQHLLEEMKEQVIDLIMEHIYAELEKDEDESDPLNKDLDEVLRITPAPTYSGQRNGRDTYRNNGSTSSANVYQSFQLTERIRSSTIPLKARKNNKNPDYDSIDDIDDDDDDDDDDDEEEDEDDDNDVQVKNGETEKTPQHGRNRLGTVFNKKVVVSPVPFSVSTRESFCTLPTTPIRYAGHLLELSTPHGFGRSMNSASKLYTKHRKSPLRLPQRHSAWQAPVCPAVWPKNIRLAPIDPSRLPSSKNRSSHASPAIQQRGRNSLSPILPPLKHTKGSCLNGDDSLEIQGQQITRSAGLNRLKSARDQSSQSGTQRNVRKRNRNKIER